MKAAHIPERDASGRDFDADGAFPSRTSVDGTPFEGDVSLPPYYGDDDPDRAARSQTTRCSRIFLAVGLAFEVVATIWAFQAAIGAGALNRYADCGGTFRLAKIHTSSRVLDVCDGQAGIDAFYDFVELDRGSSNVSFWDNFVGCDFLADAPTGEDTFDEHCSCDDTHDALDFQPCSWVALSRYSYGICFAVSVLINTNDGTIMDVFDDYSVWDCERKHPFGTVHLTIAALVTALSSQALEAFIGFKYWKDSAKQTTPTLCASLLEALGVLVVSLVLVGLPGFPRVSGAANDQALAFSWSAYAIIAVVSVGALAEAVAECSDRAARRLPYLGAVGNALIWLGAALLEVLVTLYLLWIGIGIRDPDTMAREVAGLFSLELLGLVSMWIARGLWTRAKLLRSSVKSVKGPVREIMFPSRRQLR